MGTLFANYSNTITAQGKLLPISSQDLQAMDILNVVTLLEDELVWDLEMNHRAIHFEHEDNQELDTLEYSTLKNAFYLKLIEAAPHLLYFLTEEQFTQCIAAVLQTTNRDARLNSLYASLEHFQFEHNAPKELILALVESIEQLDFY